MILYNVTVTVQEATYAEWISWMKSKHIPDVLATGLFEYCEISRHLHVGSESEVTVTFSYGLESLENLEAYQKNFAAILQEEHTKRYSGKFKAGRIVAAIEGRIHKN